MIYYEAESRPSQLGIELGLEKSGQFTAEAERNRMLRRRSWISKIFQAKQAKTGGIIRRGVKQVQKFASEQDLLREVLRRGFHLVKNGDQYIVFCNQSGLVIVC